MTNRSKYIARIITVFAISLLGTLLLMTPAKPILPQDEPYRIELFDLSKPDQLDVNTFGRHTKSLTHREI